MTYCVIIDLERTCLLIHILPDTNDFEPTKIYSYLTFFYEPQEKEMLQ